MNRASTNFVGSCFARAFGLTHRLCFGWLSVSTRGFRGGRVPC